MHVKQAAILLQAVHAVQTCAEDALKGSLADGWPLSIALSPLACCPAHICSAQFHSSEQGRDQ